MTNTADKFWASVARGEPDECWLWTKSHSTNNGYGVTHWQGRHALAHRLAWELTHGPIPAGQRVLHTCDTPLCCNPTHLFLGTHGDNMADMMAKGRHRARRGSAVGGAKLTEAQVDAIKGRLGDDLGYVIAADYGVSPSLISAIRRGHIWRHV